MSLHVAQLKHADGSRRLAKVAGEQLLLTLLSSTYEWVTGSAALEESSDPPLSYDEVYSGQSEWRLLPPLDHPFEPARCLISGTGLTHKRSAATRESMHGENDASENDSMRIYRWGEKGGRPSAGEVGTAPEWFHKGDGSILRAHGEPLSIPPFASDGGEEPEIAGLYVINTQGQPVRIGFANCNEFSDHALERQNYLYLAHSKLRECSVGPELVVGADFSSFHGEVRIERDGATLWSKAIASGEANMCHSLANIEHHHFKYAQHRRPGDVHIHFFGADAFSFGAGLALKNGDVMQVGFNELGRPLRNAVYRSKETDRPVSVLPFQSSQ